MRIHSITLTAFGSFGGIEHVDVEALSHAGLFLVHGPTGAGKSTLLDAVSFALFGSVPRDRMSNEGLRSHHAGPGVLTEVRLEVSFGADRYRIARQPRQQVPKQRGEGVTDKAPKVSVEQLVGGQWVTRATRVAEAAHLIDTHLPMNADQFHQVVMLPQGDFAKFLDASAEERRLLLEKLFATHRFAHVESWLKQQADQAADAVTVAESGLRQELAAIGAVAGVDAPFDELAAHEVRHWTDHLVTETAARTTLALQAEVSAKKAQAHAAAVLDDARRLAERQARHAAAVARKRQLDDDAAAQVDRIDRLDRAARAAEVEPVLALVDKAEAEVERLRLLVGDAELSDVEAHLESVVAAIARATQLLDDEAQLATREEARNELRTLVEAIRAQRQAIVAALDEAVDVEPLAAEVAAIEERLIAATKRDELAGQLTADEADVLVAERVALDTRRSWLDLFETQVNQRAALLAEHLADGDTCPVCGSEDHPHLAQPAADIALVHDDVLAAAAATRDRAQQAFDELSARVAARRTDLAAVQATAADATVAELRTARTEARAALATATNAATALATVVPDGQEPAAVVAQLDQRLSEVEREFGGLDTEIATGRARVQAACGDFGSLAELLAHLHGDQERAVALLGHLRSLDGARIELARLRETVTGEAAERAFASLADVRTSLLSARRIDEIRSQVEAHKAGLAAVDNDLTDPGLLAAVAEPVVDLPVAKALADQAANRWADAHSALDDARRVQADVGERAFAITERLNGLQPLLDDRAVKHDLAQLALGNDRSAATRMRLSTYVLAARLEQVAAAASERLVRMSNGRYTIVHTDEARNGRGRGGLGLQVVDAWTSTVRDTSTLSGGETFYASLALALGVADVVTAESGGSRIDTLFIDEGFGSLDDETLHDVMDVLDDLREGGRSVGVVSHVADLRTRIVTQLEVVKTPKGSRLRTQGTATEDPHAAVA